MSTPKKKVVFHFDEEIEPGSFVERSLVGRIGKGRPNTPWVSRDFAHDIPCERTACPINRERHCSVSSSIKIGPSGLCLTGQGLIQNPPAKSGTPICRWCGGRIEKVNGRWQHIGEKLSHPAEPRP